MTEACEQSFHPRQRGESGKGETGAAETQVPALSVTPDYRDSHTVWSWLLPGPILSRGPQGLGSEQSSRHRALNIWMIEPGEAGLNFLPGASSPCWHAEALVKITD